MFCSRYVHCCLHLKSWLLLQNAWLYMHVMTLFQDDVNWFPILSIVCIIIYVISFAVGLGKGWRSTQRLFWKQHDKYTVHLILQSNQDFYSLIIVIIYCAATEARLYLSLAD